MGDSKSGLAELAGRIERGDRSNLLDVLVEIALFVPDEEYMSARANFAGTKVIYTAHNGAEMTCWAPDWSDNPGTISLLAARAAS